MPKSSRIFTVILLLAAVVAVVPKVSAVTTKTDSLRAELERAENPADSIRLLYDIFDLSHAPQRNAIGYQIASIARRIHDDNTRLDVIRQMSVSYAPGDTVLQRLIDMAEEMAPSADRSETLALLRIRRTASQHGTLSPEETRKRLEENLRRLDEKGLDTYTYVELMFSICALLGIDSQSDLLTDYFDRLREHIDRLPYSNSEALRLAYYTKSAEVYTTNSEYPKAVNACRQLLGLLDTLKVRYHEKGRRFRNFDRERYNVYRRLLVNFRALSNEHIEEYYDSVCAIIDRNPEAYDDLHSNERALIYYLMALHRYREAIPILWRQYDNPQNAAFRINFLRSLIEAGQGVGDNETVMKASLALNNLLQERLHSKSGERIRELEMIYNVADLKSRNSSLEIEKKQSLYANSRNLLITVVVAFLVVVLMLLIIWRQYRSLRKLAGELNQSNELLTTERDNLRHVLQELIHARDEAKEANKRKTEFINNMAHEVTTPLNTISEYSRLIVDCMDDEKRRYMSRFSEIVTQNVDLLLTIVNDVIDLAAADHSQMRARIAPVSVHKVCMLAIDSVANRVPADVEIRFPKAQDTDFMIISDGPRISQVLINLMSNAVKFTEHGRVVLDYELSPDSKHITFSVTDTGIGIPDGMEKKIFGRFVKLNKYTQGLGLGLAISQLVARILHGRVELDKTWRQGARFTFTVPTKPED